MVLLPIFDIKLVSDLKEKWESELTKYDSHEEGKEVNIKKFYVFLDVEGHVLSKEPHEDTKNSSSKLNPRNDLVEKNVPGSRMTKSTCLCKPLSPLQTSRR